MLYSDSEDMSRLKEMLFAWQAARIRFENATGEEASIAVLELEAAKRRFMLDFSRMKSKRYNQGGTNGF